MKTLLPSLALLLAPGLAAAIPPIALPLAATQLGELAAQMADPAAEGGGTVSFNGQNYPKYIPMGPALPGQVIGEPPNAAGFNMAELTAKEAAKEAKNEKTAAKDPFLAPGMRWVPGCAHQGPPCRQEPDPAQVGPTDLVVANAGGEKIVGSNGSRDAEDARRREAERQRQADPNGQYDVTGLGGMRRPPVVAPDRVADDNGASTVASLIVDGWNDMGFGDTGAGTGPSSQQANVVKGQFGEIVGVKGVTFETASAAQGGLKQLADDTRAPISFLERVAGAGPNGVSAGNTSADDGTQGCQRGTGGDMTPCLGVSKQ